MADFERERHFYADPPQECVIAIHLSLKGAWDLYHFLRNQTDRAGLHRPWPSEASWVTFSRDLWKLIEEAEEKYGKLDG